MALYDATKAAMVAMTRTLAFEEAESGIRVNVVCPGSTLTDFHVNRTKDAGKSVEELKTQRQETSLLGRWADRQSVVVGKSVDGRVDLGGRRIIKTKKTDKKHT